MRTLYEDAYFRATTLDGEKILRVTRSHQPFETVAEADRMLVALGEALAALPLEGMALLFDARESPGRNDEAFESMLEARRDQLFGRFTRRAVLLKTMAGLLQSKRLDRRAGGRFHAEAFTDEAQALAYVRG